MKKELKLPIEELEIQMHKYPQTSEPFNIFYILRKESRSLEIFHQGFLASLLSNSVTRHIYDGFLDLIYCNGERPGSANILKTLRLETPRIRTEHNANKSGRRIDILLQFESCKTILAIEVKTVDDSTSKGQLINYFNLLGLEFPEYEVVIVYLTPFDEKNLPGEGGIKSLQALEEYSDFEKFINAEPSRKGYHCHLNWQQVTQLYKEFDNDLIHQHKRFVNESMCHPDVYRYAVAKRKLEEFVGPKILELFHQKINEYEIESENNCSYFSLKKNNDKLKNLLVVLTILFEGEGIEKEKSRKDKITDDLKDKYCTHSEFGPFFRDLFADFDKRSYVFMQGKDNIGVRVPHVKASQSVSLLTISPESIELKQMDS